MKFNLDTEHMEDISLTFSVDAYDDELSKVIQDFCIGLALFFTDFAMKFNCDIKQANALKELCLPYIEKYIDYFLEQGVLKPDANDDIPEDELTDLEERMRAKGFSESAIAACVKLVKDSGSWDVALSKLQSFANEAGVEL